MAWTFADLDALKAAIATGALQVRYADGRLTVFRSLDDMMRTRAMIEREIAGTPAASRVTYVEHCRE